MASPNPSQSRGAGAAQCASEDQLELYALGRLPAELEPAFEEHLLICQRCQDLLAATDEYLPYIRAGLAGYSERKPWWSRLAGLLAPRGMWMVAPVAAALLALVVLMPSLRRPSGNSVQVDLKTYRSAAPQAEVVGPSGVPLNLRLAAEDLAEGGSWTILIVDATGAPVRRSTSSVRHGIVACAVPEGLGPGAYWIRLMSPADPVRQVKEYSLSVK